MLQTQSVKTRDVDPILEHEMKALGGRFRGDWKTLFNLLVQSGIRTSEALALRESDLWEEGTARGIYVNRLKRRRRVRDTIQLVDLELVSELRALGRKRRPRLFDYSRQGVGKALKRYCSEAGVRPLAPHQFRHTFAREFARMSILDSSGRQVSALDHRLMLANALGHSSTRWVEIYFQPHGSELMAVTAQVGGIISRWS